MGEIRVQVRLTNAVDEALAHRGDLAAGNVRACDADAMVDTGAIQSVVPASLVEQLGLEIRATRTAQLADGSRQTVGVTGPLLFHVQDRETLEEALVLGDEVLIGQTVLEKLDLLADRARRQLVPAHPEGPISKVKRETVYG